MLGWGQVLRKWYGSNVNMDRQLDASSDYIGYYTDNGNVLPTSYFPGAVRLYGPRWWQFDSRWIYIRPQTGPQSSHLWWLAVAKLVGSQRAYSLGQLHRGPDRWTDRQIAVSLYAPIRQGA